MTLDPIALEIAELTDTLEECESECRALKCEVKRMRDRIESLRGLVKWCSGRLLDANDVESANEAMRLVGDMEPPL